MFPSIKEIAAAVENRFVVEDWHNFGADYAPTLRAWYANLAAHRDRRSHRTRASGSIDVGFLVS